MKTFLMISLTFLVGINTIRVAPLLNDQNGANFQAGFSNLKKLSPEFEFNTQLQSIQNVKQFTISAPKSAPSPTPTSPPVSDNNENRNITEYKTTDNSKPLNYKVGNEFEIKLEGNPTTGYSWYLKSLDKASNAIVSPVNLNSNNSTANYIQYPKNAEEVGVGGTFNFKFKGVANGQTKLNFDYKRPWEDTPIETKEYSVVIA
jgi:predicted secreted protein